MNQADATVAAISPRSAQEIFARQRAAWLADPFPSLEARRRVLAALEEILVVHQDAIAEAISLDFGNRSIHESKLLEVFPTVTGFSDTRKKVKKWMRPRRRHVSFWFMGAKNRVIPQPKGVVGIISPWNYPMQLALSPLTSAIAAGNRCMIKMASNSQNLCRLLQRLVSGAVSDEMVAILPGVSAADFTELPFDHLIFTGSPRTGRVVMKAAAENLTPVTLELGGKSPTIVAPDFDLGKAAERILYVKYMNAGQTCVAPDYLFLPEERVADFVEKAKALVAKRYPRIDSVDYTAIISERAFDRLLHGLEDARAKGAKIINLVPGSEPDRQLRKIPPYLVLNTTDEMILMQEEIFGPILPIRPYRDMDEAIALINAGERPLALYLFTKDKALADKVIYNTMSGGVGINDCAMHVAQHDLPFGGVGNSGMGQYHGYEGFLEFSKLRPVFKQAPMPASALLAPPYGKTFERVYNLMMKLRWL
ncbi:MAG: coniferyl aldehyde dehydrogenase [Desulfobacterales bacterium]|nr:coniferyl aldehyde dehydrogenase [Desulfobacterales bacterium]